MGHTLKDSNIAVTGAAGFIGSNLVRELAGLSPRKLLLIDNMSLRRYTGEQRGLELLKTVSYDFRLIEQDVSNYNSMLQLLRKEDINTVFNLAVLCLPLGLRKPRQVFDTNVTIASVLGELLRKGLYDVLVHFSSSEVYGSARYVPIDEDHPLDASTSYGASKAAQDLLLLSYHKTYGVDVRIIRPFNNVGPGQNDHSYSAVIPRTIRRILSGEHPEVFGDGLQTRDIIHVSETCRAAIEIATREDIKGAVINVGSGKEITILDLITKICSILGYDGKIIFKQPRPGDVRRHCADIRKAARLTGFTQRVTLDEALKATVEWYRSIFHLPHLKGMEDRVGLDPRRPGT